MNVDLPSAPASDYNESRATTPPPTDYEPSEGPGPEDTIDTPRKRTRSDASMDVSIQDAVTDLCNYRIPEDDMQFALEDGSDIDDSDEPVEPSPYQIDSTLR